MDDEEDLKRNDKNKKRKDDGDDGDNGEDEEGGIFDTILGFIGKIFGK
jgi:hypothetical protein